MLLCTLSSQYSISLYREGTMFYITKLSKVKEKNSFTLWGHRTHGSTIIPPHSKLERFGHIHMKFEKSVWRDSSQCRGPFGGFSSNFVSGEKRGACEHSSRATEDCRRLSLEKNTASSIFRLRSSERFSVPKTHHIVQKSSKAREAPASHEVAIVWQLHAVQPCVPTTSHETPVEGATLPRNDVSD